MSEVKLCSLVLGRIKHHALSPEPNDFQSNLIQRCVMALSMGVSQSEVLEICSQAGQTPEHAFLTYQAAMLLAKYRQEGVNA